MSEVGMAAVGAVFVLAGVMKFARPGGFRGALRGLGVPAAWRAAVTAAVATGELLVGGALVLWGGRVPVAFGVVMLVGYSGALLWLRRAAPRVGCGCLGDSGVEGQSPDLLRNVLLTAALLPALLSGAPRVEAQDVAIGVQLALLVLVASEAVMTLRGVNRLASRLELE
jgi:uncharacterized membrane protein YphA (DoxX/SURF4 family)